MRECGVKKHKSRGFPQQINANKHKSGDPNTSRALQNTSRALQINTSRAIPTSDSPGDRGASKKHYNRAQSTTIKPPLVVGLTPSFRAKALTPSALPQSLEQKQSLSGSWHKDHSHTYNTSSRIKSSIRDRRFFKALNCIHVASSIVFINHTKQPQQKRSYQGQHNQPQYSHPITPKNQHIHQIPARIRA